MPAPIYPPYVDNVIPAFNNKKLSIPFTHNPAVDQNSFSIFVFALTPLNDDNTVLLSYWDYKGQAIANNQIDFLLTGRAGESQANLDKLQAQMDSLKVGTYYKVKLAYSVGSGVDGPYSTPAITKYIGATDGSISEFDNSDGTEANTLPQSYTIKMSYGDITETLYSAQIDFYEAGTKNLYYSSGEIFHNASGDKITSERLITINYTPNIIFDSSRRYDVVLSCKSFNQNVFTISYLNKSVLENITPIKGAALTVEQSMGYKSDYENGVIKITLQQKAEETFIDAFEYHLCRINGNVIEDLGQIKKDIPFYDNTIEQGVVYEYFARGFNGNALVGETEHTNPITADFEYIFISDGERQLKVSYDGKITSFKETVLESKQDTIGGKYPVFFRNGDVGYKEFQITGLLSYLADERQMFMSYSDLGLAAAGSETVETGIGNSPTINLTGYNFAAERKFKMEVAAWLNNGLPKLVRTPAEGNFIVRLMNISLTPKDQVSRLLHSFSCTAYECAECNYENMKKYLKY